MENKDKKLTPEAKNDIWGWARKNANMLIVLGTITFAGLLGTNSIYKESMDELRDDEGMARKSLYAICTKHGCTHEEALKHVQEAIEHGNMMMELRIQNLKEQQIIEEGKEDADSLASRLHRSSETIKHHRAIHSKQKDQEMDI